MVHWRRRFHNIEYIDKEFELELTESDKLKELIPIYNQLLTLVLSLSDFLINKRLLHINLFR